MRATASAAALVVGLVAGPVALAEPIERVLDGTQVSEAQLYTAQTPVAVRDGQVFLVTLETGPKGEGPQATDVRTVLRHGRRDGSGAWSWTSKVIEDRTAHDPYHTAASVGIDEAGYVHVVYNMHNFPWQYKVSTQPLSIEEFEFRGQAISQAEIDRHQFENKTTFPDLGTAAIPGNQVTYPAFENDRSGRLYVSYRYATKPARGFEERTMSSGVARYDAASRTWTSVGGLLEYGPGDHRGSSEAEATLRAVASQTGWTSYSPRMTFGPNDEMNVSVQWREGIAGAMSTRPCAVTTVDGETFTDLAGTPMTLPLRPWDCPNVATARPGTQYFTLGDAAADEAGHHYLLLSPQGRGREIHRWDGAEWRVEPSPDEAVEIFFDDAWNLWAVGTGLSLNLRRRGEDAWERIRPSDGRVQCLPHAALDTDRSAAFVFAMGCDGASASSVTRLDLRALRGDEPGAPAAATTVPAPVAGPVAEAPPATPLADDPTGDDPTGDAPAADGVADGVAADPATDAAASDPASGPASGPAADPTGEDPAFGPEPDEPRLAAGTFSLPPTQWHRFAVPADAERTTPAALFGAALSPDTYGIDWVIFGVDAAGSTYYQPWVDDVLDASDQYWIIHARPDGIAVGLAAAQP